MNTKEQLDAALGRASELSKAAGERELTEEELTEVKSLAEQIPSLKAKVKADEDNADLIRRLGDYKTDAPKDNDEEKPAADLGEHFIKSGIFEQMRRAKSAGSRFTASGPEFKAATDPTLTTGITIPPQFGPVIQTKYRRLTIADLLSSGTISGNSLTYWTQGTLTGDVASVAQGALKPSLNFAFGQTTESLTKLAGVTKVSDEMAEDADFLVSVIRSQLLQRLAVIEEDQLLNGNGTAPNLRGLLNRSGIQTYSTTATATPKKWMDGLFHAMTLVRTGSFIEPDGIIVNPTDYETMRLGVDGQSQYYGGGPFTGAYGNDGFQMQPGLWGLPTVVTPAIAAGTALVGGFGTSAQVFRKGGVRLESTNANENDFLTNLIAIRAEERLALAVYYPTALCKVTLTA